MSEEAKRMAERAAWICDYCGSHGHPMDHGCLPIKLKERIESFTLQLKQQTELIEELIDVLREMRGLADVFHAGATVSKRDAQWTYDKVENVFFKASQLAQRETEGITTDKGREGK